MADDILLKLDGIPGESKKSGHENEIDIMSVGWGLTNSTQSVYGGGGGGAGNANFSDITISKGPDAASNLLMLRCADGKPISEAKFTFRKQGGEQQEYMILTLNNVYVSSISMHGGSGGEPVETASLSFDKYEFKYFQQKDDGSLGGAKTANWDVKKASK
jgi:type VI secretion system secreted protein Hcp